jgi:chromatin remodeling complex protein RSC6
MSKPSKSSKSVKAEVAPAVVEAAVAAAQEVQKSVKRTKTEKASVPVVEPVSVVVEEVSTVVDTESVVRKQRRQVTRDDVEKDFDSLLATLDAEVESLRNNDDKSKSKGVRFLRSVTKQVRQLRSDSLRVASKKTRRESTVPRSTNSGFMKPVKISKDMQKFTGIKDDQLVSRVDVTKAICQYVKTNNLQNQADRRQFTPDEKLAKLLGTKEPLTYYALQKQIQPHFTKPVPVTSA